MTPWPLLSPHLHQNAAAARVQFCQKLRNGFEATVMTVFARMASWQVQVQTVFADVQAAQVGSLALA